MSNYENQVAIITLGYEDLEFSTQDIIDRLGIVDIDQLQQTITPLRHLGLLERSKSHAQAYKHAEAHRIPKREVPTYRVIDHGTASVQQSEIKLDTSIEEPDRLHKLFIANIEYQMTKGEIVTWLSSTCDVRGLEIPSGIQYGSVNRGFAFATVAYEGSIADLVNRLDGTDILGRRVHVQPQRDVGTA